MPFTFAHPAAAIPLCRPLGRYAVLSALVVGSMAPDFWLFLPLHIAHDQTHSLAGLFWFCVPIGLATYLFFHVVMKQPLASLLPPPYARRLALYLAQTPIVPRVPFFCVLVSLAAGSLTHFAWDLFTHWRSRPQWLPDLLREPVISVGSHAMDGVSLLQHASTALGVLLIAWWSWRWLRRAPDPASSALPMPAPGLRYIALGIVAVMPAAALAKAMALPPWQSHAVPAAIAALQGLVWALIGYSVLWQASRIRSALRGARGS